MSVMVKGGGGASPDFVTAGAEQILQGYIGSDIEGEPVEGQNKGWFSGAKVTGLLEIYSNNDNGDDQYYTFPCSGKPKAVIIMGVKDSNRQAYATAEYLNEKFPYAIDDRTCGWIDGVTAFCAHTNYSGDIQHFFRIHEVTDTQVTLYVYTKNGISARFYCYYEFYY